MLQIYNKKKYLDLLKYLKNFNRGIKIFNYFTAPSKQANHYILNKFNSPIIPQL